ncbi:RHS repeat-associated core domain-containing protein [Streptomyces beijiangensis]|uniref:RHS repeat-associated core domain-containing protein n=1 Tax=Streptomyces beijiangensis TaxID=163361 RepID=UPI001F5D21CC|nr:RHS repeat-associated core domain-containing protein [Streptomyces beijiangensis]
MSDSVGEGDDRRDNGRHASQTSTQRGWLGSKQRSSETVTGATLMGIRLYDPTAGRFLSVDRIAGGSANAYDYAGANPVTNTDLNGTMIVCGGGRTGSQCNRHRDTRWTSEGRHTYTTKWHASDYSTMPARLRNFLQTLQGMFMVGIYVDGAWWRYRYTRYGRWHSGKWQTKKGHMDLYAEQPRIKYWVDFFGYFTKTGPWDYFEYYN